ncbi:trypsin-like peptidase domain-containing protein [Streptomyces cupreus]|uniref:Trypsin-like peptidase domain-containing protein n=1 Tax=Streptomyces cupreus TaxID=2759956 RepID=A0A7X1J8U1_9ACTN|nr:trypsin-like peptidase domain-containing protein [Streptomyces cupreus]MBC2906241.1 trypsin-like peptidase domain-containing protein [Streptomyces cupreus]
MVPGDPDRAAEVIVTLPDASGRRGSGYRLTAGAVLTAAHVIDGHSEVTVRFNADSDDEWTAAATVAWSSAEEDAAVLAITPRPKELASRGVVFGRVADVDAETACSILGFPRFKLRDTDSQASSDAGAYRDSCHRVGHIPALSHRRQGPFEIRVAPPEYDADPARYLNGERHLAAHLALPPRGLSPLPRPVPITGKLLRSHLPQSLHSR